MRIYYHPQFRKSYRRLSVELKKKAEEKEHLFRDNPFHPQLKTHKLHGKLRTLWSFSIDLKYRIIFELDGGDSIFLDVGDHDVYQ